MTQGRGFTLERDITHRQPIMARGQYGYVLTYTPPHDVDGLCTPTTVYEFGYDGHTEAQVAAAKRVESEGVCLSAVTEACVVIRTRKLVVSAA